MHLSPLQVVCLVLSPLLLCQCSTLTQSIAVEGELSSPETSLPRYEYPFDESGRYREDWVNAPRKGGGSTVSSSRTRLPLSPARHTDSAGTTSVTPKVSAPPTLSPAPTPSSMMASVSPGTRRQEYHTVTRGDTLWSISRQYGVSVSDIKAENGISADSIRAGDVIRLP